MGMKQTSLHCKNCGKQTLHAKPTFGDGMGCLLTIITGGLFLPVWIVIGIGEMFERYTCQICGMKNR